MQLRIPADNRRVAKPPLALTSRSRYFGWWSNDPTLSAFAGRWLCLSYPSSSTRAWSFPTHPYSCQCSTVLHYLLHCMYTDGIPDPFAPVWRWRRLLYCLSSQPTMSFPCLVRPLPPSCYTHFSVIHLITFDLEFASKHILITDFLVFHMTICLVVCNWLCSDLNASALLGLPGLRFPCFPEQVPVNK